MRKNLTVLFCLCIVLQTGNLLIAQSTTSKKEKKPHLAWELGVLVGGSLSQNDMNNFGLKQVHPAGSILLKKNLSKTFAFRASFVTGSLSGNDKNLTTHAARGYFFETPFNEFSLMAEYDFMGKSRYPASGFEKTWSPYIGVGAGMCFTQPDNTFYNETNNVALGNLIAQDKINTKSKENRFITTPIIVGIKRDINDKMMFHAEAGLRLVYNDYLDGVSLSGNPSKDDTYAFGALGISFKLGAGKDADNDGVADNLDACPEVPGLAAFKGCPDTDGDGVEDKKDQCPNDKGLIEMKGCPDSDSDGIVDMKDECPAIAGLAAFKGCPDSDGDGIEDAKDECPTETGLPALRGCPDADGDGIEDNRDKCPNEKGVALNNGCPEIVDMDKDGVLDKNDLCPSVPGLAAFKGCPDSDGDGVEDSKDKCPSVAGTIDNNGCPEIKMEDKKILEDALYGVKFETGSNVIKPVSYLILNKVVEVMMKYPEYKLTIAGHTDNTGSATSNQTLSENRAVSCSNYLASKGVAATRMTQVGYGSTLPLAENKTAAGRAKNRRVEFTLSAK
ncbi:MAG: DUF6089 family protein [Saprospiraceae bacterium]